MPYIHVARHVTTAGGYRDPDHDEVAPEWVIGYRLYLMHVYAIHLYRLEWAISTIGSGTLPLVILNLFLHTCQGFKVFSHFMRKCHLFMVQKSGTKVKVHSVPQ